MAMGQSPKYIKVKKSKMQSPESITSHFEMHVCGCVRAGTHACAYVCVISVEEYKSNWEHWLPLGKERKQLEDR